MLDVSQIVGAIIFCTILFLRGKRIVWRRVKRLDCFLSLNKSLYKGDCYIVCVNVQKRIYLYSSIAT